MIDIDDYVTQRWSALVAELSLADRGCLAAYLIDMRGWDHESAAAILNTSCNTVRVQKELATRSFCRRGNCWLSARPTGAVCAHRRGETLLRLICRQAGN